VVRHHTGRQVVGAGKEARTLVFTFRSGRLVGVWLASTWLVVLVLLDVATPSSIVFVPFFPLAALIACAVLPAGRTAVFAVAALVAAVASGWWDDAWDTDTGLQWVRMVNALLVGAAAVTIAAVRERREREYARMVAIAAVAQQAILPTIPRVIGSVAVAARYESAADDALVGGDLYDYCHDGSTNRFMIGDVRGKGLDAVVQAARTIRAHRQFASAERTMPEVARAMSSYLMPFLDEEEFVTALLVDVSDPAFLEVVSCGHPPPLLVGADGKAWLPELPAGLPLGLGRDYESVKVPWRSGARLLMYTDGLSEARDSRGEFLAPDTLVGPLATQDMEQALDVTLGGVRRHLSTSKLRDDLALVLVENRAGTGRPNIQDGRSASQGADGPELNGLTGRASHPPPVPGRASS
jgi:sigma-B regulation protein RsbU (phosphoserine phosphatase)